MQSEAKSEGRVVLVDFGHCLTPSLLHVMGTGPDDVGSSAPPAPSSHLYNYTSVSLGEIQVLGLYVVMPLALIWDLSDRNLVEAQVSCSGDHCG